MVAAGYCMYGSAIDLVITFMNGVHRFTLDDSIGEFVYIGPMSFPAKNKTIYSCNEGNYQLWDPKIQQAVETNPLLEMEEGAEDFSADDGEYDADADLDVERSDALEDLVDGPVETDSDWDDLYVGQSSPGGETTRISQWEDKRRRCRCSPVVGWPRPRPWPMGTTNGRRRI